MRFISTLTITATLTICSAIFVSCSAAKHLNGEKRDISPLDYGLRMAKTGVERYEVLRKTHQAAVNMGVNVDYGGIKTIKIDIPENASPIPLTRYNDFKGCVIEVKNTMKSNYLFGAVEKEQKIAVPKKLIDSGNFRSIDILKSGCFLLLIEDEKPWVANRKGYSYGHKRKDILLVENGVAKNKAVIPYNNAYSEPRCSYIKLSKEPLVIKNLTIKRDVGCTALTHIATISGQNDVQIENVKIVTPMSKLVNDRGILIRNCTNVSFRDVRIEGTYSQKDYSGYGVCLDNIWNLKAVRMYGKANWGVFGNNNINVATITDSEINRFDIHCYGRDVSFKNVEFFDLYNQYSSVYGTISYDHCTFTDFVPVLNGGSYNSFVEHEVVFKDCVMNTTKNKNFLFRFTGLNEGKNVRHELAEKCLPNVTIRNMTINMTDGTKDFYLYYCKSSEKKVENLGGLSKIDIEGLKIMDAKGKKLKRMALSNIELRPKKAVKLNLNDNKSTLTKSQTLNLEP